MRRKLLVDASIPEPMSVVRLANASLSGEMVLPRAAPSAEGVKEGEARRSPPSSLTMRRRQL